MNEIDSEYLVKGNYYYIQDNSSKYIGSFLLFFITIIFLLLYLIMFVI